MQNQINPSELIVYGINSFINDFSKDDSKKQILDLNNLKKKFKIDYTFDDELNQIEPSEYPSFSQLTYNERIDGKLYSYSRPPLGPIDNFSYCSVCYNSGPDYHKEDCDYPEKRSLYLTFEGLVNYIIRNPNYSGKLDELKSIWNSNKLSIEDIDKYILSDYFIDIKDGKIVEEDLIQNKNVQTNIILLDVIKTKGPDKIEYKTQTTSYNETLLIRYELNQDFKTSIRISKNGKINLIHIPINDIDKNKMYSQIISRINEHPDTFIDLDEYKLIPEISYNHSINSQFYLFPNKDSGLINFENLYNNIYNVNSRGKLIDSQFTKIENDNIIVLISPRTNKYIKIYKIKFSKGKITYNLTKTRQEINCIIIPADGIKIHLTIFKSGVFQMSMSYCNFNDIRGNICAKLINNKAKYPLKIEYLELIREIFIDIFNSESEFYSTYITSSNTDIKNSISGKKTIYKQGTTQVCRNNDRGFNKRPIPYTWKGTCPENSHYLEFKGIFSHIDGKYYPCCAPKKIGTDEEIGQYLKSGFPKDREEAEEYGVTKEIDYNSGVLENVDIGANTEAFIDGKFKKIKILSQADKSKTPMRFKVKIIDTSQEIEIEREQLKPDSRYFPGLKNFSKQQLIKCILKKYQFTDNITVNEDNIKALEKYITINKQSYNNILSLHNIDIFTRDSFYVTSIPTNSIPCYLFISTNELYVMDTNGNKMNDFEFSDITIDDDNVIIFYGFYINKQYYIIDLLYYKDNIESDFNSKIQLINEIDFKYLIISDNIILPDFQDNIIETSYFLLEQYKDISLIFIPKSYNCYLNYKQWNPNLIIDKTIVLQILKQNKTVNHYSIGYEDKSINANINLDDIIIKKQFRDSNNVKVKDYVLFEFDYSLATGKLSKDFLQPKNKIDMPKLDINDTLTKISLIVFPIKESFFTNINNDNKHVWYINSNELIYNNEDTPLIKN